MTDKELRERLGAKIAQCVDRQSFTIMDMDDIEYIIKEAGYVRLAEDQMIVGRPVKLDALFGIDPNKDVERGSRP